jgi:hypothetical protein
MKRLTIAFVGFVLGVTAPVAAPWVEWPPGPTDSELEAVVRAAYSGAVSHARTNLNYFARDDDFAELRASIAAEIARQGHSSVDVSVSPSIDLDAARSCAEAGIALRIALNMFGDGISLAAASPKRVFSYQYEPHEDPAVVVAPSAECAK